MSSSPLKKEPSGAFSEPLGHFKGCPQFNRGTFRYYRLSEQQQRPKRPRMQHVHAPKAVSSISLVPQPEIESTHAGFLSAALIILACPNIKQEAFPRRTLRTLLSLLLREYPVHTRPNNTTHRRKRSIHDPIDTISTMARHTEGVNAQERIEQTSSRV